MDLQTLKGTTYYPAEEKILRNKIVAAIQKTFERYGFQPLETPILENLSILMSKYAGGEEIVKEIYKLKDQGKRDLGLRYDLTVPLASYIGENPAIKLPFKRYEIGKVFRDGPVKTGRMREFWQCDGDVIGVKGMLAEAELLTLAKEVFSELNLDVEIKINNRKLLNSIMNSSGIKRKDDAILSLDKLEKAGKDEVEKELKGKGFTDVQIKSLFRVINITGTNVQIISALKNKISDDEGKEGISELEELLGLLKKFGTNVKIGVSLARGLAYYTGTIYEIFLKKGEIKSSLAAGGRWDSMVGKFLDSGREYPAAGISFGLEPITYAMKGRKEKSTTKAYVIPIGTRNESIKILQELRMAGINADMDMLERSPGKNLEYANRMEIPFSVLIGETELKKGKVKLKDMKTGKEKLVSAGEVKKILKS